MGKFECEWVQMGSMAQEIATDDGAELTGVGIDLSDSDLSVDDYRDMDHIEVVTETDGVVVLRDDAGYELNEWANDLGISRSDLSEQMHDIACKHYGRAEATGSGDPWSVCDPLVLEIED